MANLKTNFNNTPESDLCQFAKRPSYGMKTDPVFLKLKIDILLLVVALPGGLF
jgi:hypothetical protein